MGILCGKSLIKLHCLCADSVDIAGSTASTGSEGEQSLHAGVCVKQTSVSPKDAYIAKEALELLVTCLQLRSPLLGKLI